MAILLLSTAGGVSAQSFESPIVPGGQLLLQFDPLVLHFDAFYRADGRAIPIGSVDGVGLPLAVVRIQERHIPIHGGYGLTNWLTLRVTAPFFVRRIERAVRNGTELDEVVSDIEAGIWRLGDMEASVAARLLDLSGGGTDAPPTLQYRASVGALFRLGTSQLDTISELLQLHSHHGRTDLELQLLNDISLAGRMGLRLDLRYGTSVVEGLERFFVPAAELFDPTAAAQLVTWDPGNYQAVDVSPRFFLTPELALGGRYHLLRRGAQSFTPPGGTAPIDLPGASGDAYLHSVGGSLVYSTLQASRDGRASRPFELRANYERAVAGSGGAAQTGIFAAGVRLFLY